MIAQALRVLNGRQGVVNAINHLRSELADLDIYHQPRWKDSTFVLQDFLQIAYNIEVIGACKIMDAAVLEFTRQHDRALHIKLKDSALVSAAYILRKSSHKLAGLKGKSNILLAFLVNI